MAAAALVFAAAAVPLAAQTTGAEQTRGAARPLSKDTAEQLVESRFQISQMERALEGAVEHRANLFRQRLQAVLPAQLMIAENARVRGFRLDGYGIFFDVEVPAVEGTVTALAWSLRTLDQNDLGLDRAFKEIKAAIEAKGDTNLDQALKRIELQMAPAMAVAGASPPAVGARNAVGSPAAVGE